MPADDSTALLLEDIAFRVAVRATERLRREALPLMTIEEAAELLRVDRRKVQLMLRSGELTRISIDGLAHPRIARREILDQLDQQLSQARSA